MTCLHAYSNLELAPYARIREYARVCVCAYDYAQVRIHGHMCGSARAGAREGERDTGTCAGEERARE